MTPEEIVWDRMFHDPTKLVHAAPLADGMPGVDFFKLWHSSRADEVRAGIRAGECDCPLANQSYANMLLSPRSMANVAATVVKAKLGGRSAEGDGRGAA